MMLLNYSVLVIAVGAAVVAGTRRHLLWFVGAYDTWIRLDDKEIIERIWFEYIILFGVK